MRKSLLTISLVALLCGQTTARTLSPSEALERAFGSDTRTGALRAPSHKAPLMTVGTQESPALYVFDQGEQGYIIVSADDVAAPVLGYSDSGSIDPENLPDNLRWWLGEYKAQIEAAASKGADAYTKINRAERTPIAPLLKTTWDQSTPYNDSCPLLNGRRTVSGCVATAMAQVMKYHRWPEKITKIFRYEWEAGNSILNWAAKDLVFAWDQMLDTYHNKQYTSEQGKAVATLMKACGYSVNMNYNVPAKGGSGAGSTLIPGALSKYFNYDKGAYNAYRPFYSITEWENLIYDNLKDCGPVIYSGNNNSSGHCFVCDGYSGNGYFHFNWGWSGISDGYYLLSALDPELQGIGGSTSGFNDNQEIALGIKPAGSVPSSIKKIILCYGDLSAQITPGNPGALTVIGPFFNLSTDYVVGRIGLRFVQDNGTSRDVLGEQSTLQALSGYSSMTFSGASLPTGTWKVFPIFKFSSGETIIIPCHADQAGYLNYTKTGTKMLVTVPEIGRYSVTDMKIETPMYLDSKFLVTGKGVWTGNNSVSTAVYGVLMTGTSAQSIIAFGATMPQEFKPDGEPVAFNYVSSDWYKISTIDGVPTMTKANVTPGTYYFALAIEKGYNFEGYTLISTPVQVNIQLKPTQTKIYVTSLTVNDPTNVNPDNFQVSANVFCQAGYFFDYLIVAVFDRATGANVGQFNTNIVPLEVNGKATLTAKGILTDVTPGKDYIAQIFTPKGDYLNKSITFTIASNSGIDDITADPGRSVTASPNPASDYTVITASDDIRRIDIASLSGSLVAAGIEIDGPHARVDVASLPSGLYIARVATANGVETVKILKR